MNSGSVKKSVIIDDDLEKVWSKISKITKLDWLEGQKSTKLLGEKKSGIGAKRLISFEDGSDVEEHIVGWRIKRIFFIYCNFRITIRCISCNNFY